jgi:hypothetical protein
MLQTLDLSCCSIADDGAAALSAMLQVHPSLRRLLLSQNPFTWVGAAAIAAGATAGGRLQELDMSRVNVGRHGFCALLRCLQVCSPRASSWLQQDAVIVVNQARLEMQATMPG